MRVARSILSVLAAAGGLSLAARAGLADISVDAPIPQMDGYELLVLEADGCTYCGLFRRDVLPAYKTSERGKDMPVRFLDVNDIPASKLNLETPVDIVPTFVVLKHNKEVGRIPGYTGPENFFHTINYILGSAP